MSASFELNREHLVLFRWTDPGQTPEELALSILRAHRFTIEYGEGTLTVRPIAHLSAGKIRVPIGWVRNEIEVPFSMLLDELSARSDVEIEPA